MLGKLSNKPVIFTFGDSKVKFSSLDDFEFAMAGRNTLSTKKVIEIIKYSLAELKEETRKVRKVEKKLVEILSESLLTPNSIDSYLRKADRNIFSNDHGWRKIISCLCQGGEELNTHRHIAVAKYTQYLHSKQELIEHIYYYKKSAQDESKTDKNTDTNLGETMFFSMDDNSDLDIMNQYISDDFEKMLKGDGIIISLDNQEVIEIYLSKYPCKIVSGKNPKFIDGDGKQHAILNGINSVGRSNENNICIETVPRYISRKHLIIEYDGKCFKLLDLSSHGTYLHKKYLKDNTFL